MMRALFGPDPGRSSLVRRQQQQQCKAGGGGGLYLPGGSRQSPHMPRGVSWARAHGSHDDQRCSPRLLPTARTTGPQRGGFLLPLFPSVWRNHAELPACRHPVLDRGFSCVSACLPAAGSIHRGGYTGYSIEGGNSATVRVRDPARSMRANFILGECSIILRRPSSKPCTYGWAWSMFILGFLAPQSKCPYHP